MKLSRPLLLFIVLASITPLVRLSAGNSALTYTPDQANREREIAATFAPVFYQALGDKPRSDYVTNFDFDGDWRGDNNWDHAADERFPLKAYVYYSVAETQTHFFIHYAVFHPRDYKGGERKGAILSELIREGARRGGKFDPTGLAEETALAHENDLEGCLVVAAKNGSELAKARTSFVETLHHNQFSRYVVGDSASKGFEVVRLEAGRPLLYIEPKGHGIQALDQTREADKSFIIYRFTGKAEEPKGGDNVVGYDLLPLETTLWARARTGTIGESNATYGEVNNYGTISLRVVRANGKVVETKVKVGSIGAAFLGKVGGVNMARPPWGWFSRNNRTQTPGLWFFDPARTTKQNYKLGDSFSTVYVRAPFWATPK